MRICRIEINNFRGIKKAIILLPIHAVMIGDNNTGKTTILEALDLTLGPDRLNRFPPIDEHDFYQGSYLPKKEGSVDNDENVTGVEVDSEVETVPVEQQKAPLIEIEVVIVDLSNEQQARFGSYIEYWNTENDTIYEEPILEGIDCEHIDEALRVTFRGKYDEEEDDFIGRTYFSRSLTEDHIPIEFRKKDKQICGFLYLRSLRTGNRALSMERGSLLDIILRLNEIRPKMWEDIINDLHNCPVAADPNLGISGILDGINASLKKYVPKEWGVGPHLKVSNLTREHLRKIITVFIYTGEGEHAAPFYRQGTGTINMLVLAMLSQIATKKQNVIFAMEEPETAIPPYAQKRIVHEIRQLTSQAIFTSHSPYVIEEFKPDETVVLSQDGKGELTRKFILLPKNLKLKNFRQKFRTSFCEGLLSRRILIAEGETEATAFPAVCRRLYDIDPLKYSSLEALGICTVNAGGENKIPIMANLFRDLGKKTIALCDKQDDDNTKLIRKAVNVMLMHEEKGFENLVLNGTTDTALLRFAKSVDWPDYIKKIYPDPVNDARAALTEYFSRTKGNFGIAEFLDQCDENEIPEWLRDACKKIKRACNKTPNKS